MMHDHLHPAIRTWIRKTREAFERLTDDGERGQALLRAVSYLEVKHAELSAWHRTGHHGDNPAGDDVTFRDLGLARDHVEHWRKNHVARIRAGIRLVEPSPTELEIRRVERRIEARVANLTIVSGTEKLARMKARGEFFAEPL